MSDLDGPAVIFEIEMNESGTVLTIKCYTDQAITIEEFAAELSDFVEDLRVGDAEVILVPDDMQH